LIKEFGEESVIKFVKSSAGKNTISLGARNVKKEIEKIKNTLDNAPTHVTIEVTVKESLEFKPRKTFGTRTLVNILKEIEKDA
jgi:hypothetical protein